MSWLRVRSHNAQVSGSTSSGGRLAPAICPPTQVVSEISGANARVKSGSRLRPDHGGVISSTSWPSDSSSAAASLRRLRARRVDRRALVRRRGREPDPEPSRIDLSEPGVAARGHGRRPTSHRRARGPASTSSTAAVSPTDRVSTPSETRKLCPPSGPTETRPRAGFSPTSPQHDAGIRIEPPPSLPCATGTIPAATAAAAPPLDPPGVRSSVPRVARRAEPPRLGRRQDAHLGHRGLADDHEPGLAQAAHEERVVAGDELAEQVAAHRQRHPRRPAGCP